MKRRANGEGSVVRVKGSRFWYILYRIEGGRQVRESSKSEVKQVALNLLQKRLGERAIGLQPAQDVKKLHYEEIRKALLDDYAIKRNRSLIDNGNGGTIWGLPHLDGFFGGKSVSKITTDSLRQFIKKRLADGAEPGTVNRNLALLRRMLFLAKQDGKIQSVCFFPMLRENPPRKGFLTHEQFERLLAALPERLRPVVTFLYFTGARLGEMKKILWSQIDLDRHAVRLEGEQTKNAEPRILPLPDVLVETLRAVPNKTGRLFEAGNFRKAWQNACVAAELGQWKDPKKKYEGYSGLIVHDLRRSAIRNMISAGVSEKVAMTVSGHKTRSVFDRYHIVSEDDLHRAMRRVQSAARPLPAVTADTSLKQALPEPSKENQ